MPSVSRMGKEEWTVNATFDDATYNALLIAANVNSQSEFGRHLAKTFRQAESIRITVVPAHKRD